MGSEVQRNPYRDAYIAANAELDEVIEQFAKLRARKQKVETALEALQQLVEGGGQVIPINQQARTTPAEPGREVPAPTPATTPASAPVQLQQVEMRAGAAQPGGGAIPETLEKRIASALGRVAFA